MKKITFMTAVSAAALIVCGAIPAKAQQMDYGSLESLFGEPVTTSATGKPQRASEAPVSMTILTAEDIRRTGATDIAGALSNVPGLSIWQWSRKNYDVNVRGNNQQFSSRLLVLVNGRQVYLDHYGITMWQNIPVQLGEIRQIEVVKGANTALFGFNAVDGVVNIVTYNPIYDDKSSATVTVGSAAYRQGDIISTFKLGEKTAVRFSGSMMSSNEYSSDVNGTEDPIDFVDPTRDSYNVDAVSQLTDKSQIRVELSGTNQEANNMIPLMTVTAESYKTRGAKASYEIDSSAGLIKATVYKNWMDLLVLDSSVDVNMHNEVLVAQLEDTFKVGADHTLRIMGEYRDNGLTGNVVGEGAEVGYKVYALSGMWNWLINDNFEWTNAVRGDILKLSRTGGSFISANPFTNDDYDQSVEAFSYNSGLVWKVSDADKIRLSTARGIEAPGLYDFGKNFTVGPAVIVGNPTENPMVVTNYEISWDRNVLVINGGTTASVFYKTMQDVKGAETSYNIGSSKTAGLELAAHGKFSENYSWDLSYMLESVKDDLEPSAGEAKNFEDTTSRNSAKAHLGYKSGAWEADGYAYYVSKFQGFEPTGTGTYTLEDVEGYYSLSARIGYNIDDKTSIALSGQNIQASSTTQTRGLDVDRTVYLTLKREF